MMWLGGRPWGTLSAPLDEPSQKNVIGLNLAKRVLQFPGTRGDGGIVSRPLSSPARRVQGTPRMPTIRKRMLNSDPVGREPFASLVRRTFQGSAF